jgi:hypothetical protein
MGILKEHENDEEIDIPTFTNTMQARIIVSIAVGEGKADVLLDYEQHDGTMVKKTFCKILQLTLN